MDIRKQPWIYFIIPVLGVCFWFIIGYPFANRNESYLWVTFLEQSSFLDILQNPIPSIRNFRPLAQALTWILYHLSGGNGLLVQFLNFTLLCISIWIMIPLLDRSKSLVFRFAYLILGFIYIPAFYFVFNLHGIFYSPILLFVATLLRAHEDVLLHWKKWFIISLALTFFHPFMVLFYVAFLVGLYIEREHFKVQQIITLAAILVTLGVIVNLLLPFPVFSVINIQNLLGTARNVEAHLIIKIFTFVLCLITILQRPRIQQYILICCIIVYLPISIVFNFPLLLLLGGLTLFNLVTQKRWAVAGLVAVSIAFPLAVGSGAPTKASIFIFLVPYLLLADLTIPWNLELKVFRTLSLMTTMLVLTAAILLRNGTSIPYLTGMIKPLLVEKGKTFQLEQALAEAQKSTPPNRIQFIQEKQGNIRDHGQPKNRDFFPPTKQKELDSYQHFLLQKHQSENLPVWYISFGESIQTDTLEFVTAINDKNCKPLYVYQLRE